ncbi:HNH endonuclease [Haliscomenobacter hydrossis]|uniref:HNH endonuclease n=1 Tax=Haliscomenobacter hydrossis (strain ATCC 27775 / DSM 1100 / LMG 10767 / O) TaxID=760192 RepID=F4L1J7_HALH1|nr:HNH endonuclease signature motif containing protein [Haliscomenobacter hydrossis]AEE48541.1 HNH endonuclease [Haliscomenobacter hydrossis DSM 1100]
MGLTKKTKGLVALRANYCCEYCRSQEQFSPSQFSVDHIIPSSKLGGDDLDNLCYACQACNNFKYVDTSTTDPITGQNFTLFNPRQHHWEEHFLWNEDTTELIGITPIGRATIVKLKLNRQGVVNLRKALKSLGLYP